MSVLRNVLRRKGRAFLTIFGITIGVFALVVMGAMAEKLNLMVDGGVRYYGDKVTVTDSGVTGPLGSPLSVRKVAEIERVPGVARASASLAMMLSTKPGSVSIGVPPMIMGGDGRAAGLEKFKVTYREGRELRPTEVGACTLGSEMAVKLDARVGDVVKLRDKPFRVVGILEKTLTAPDQCAYMNLADAQKLYLQDLPAAVRTKVDPRDLCTAIAVYPRAGVNPEKLARIVQSRVPGIKASGPAAFVEQVGSSMKLFNGIIFGVALISLVVGGMSVVNTMTMAVAERTREIGIRKAIGASHVAILRQFVAESGVIGMAGGLTGLALGALVVAALNAGGGTDGTALFQITTRLALGAVSFAVALGIVSGLYPAWHAAGLNPVRALRYE